MAHNHMVLIPGTMVPPGQCGYVPYATAVGHTPDQIREDVCRQPGDFTAAKVLPDIIMSGFLCSEHAPIIQNCPDCPGIEIKEKVT